MQSSSMVGSVNGFIESALFSRTFKEGMALVEETANYLDGDGREASKSMSRSGAISYAGASMRLTTQLMQIASWLLVLRALREGDMTIEEAADDKYRIECREPAPSQRRIDALPDDLIALITRADQLFDRIARLDRGLFVDTGQSETTDAQAQQRALAEAFRSPRQSKG